MKTNTFKTWFQEEQTNDAQNNRIWLKVERLLWKLSSVTCSDLKSCKQTFIIMRTKKVFPTSNSEIQLEIWTSEWHSSLKLCDIQGNQTWIQSTRLSGNSYFCYQTVKSVISGLFFLSQHVLTFGKLNSSSFEIWWWFIKVESKVGHKFSAFSVKNQTHKNFIKFHQKFHTFITPCQVWPC